MDGEVVLMRRMMLYDRLGNPLGELAEADVFDAVLREEINGEHSLEITTTRVLDKGIRLLYEDGRSKWREFAVAGIDAEHASGERAIGTYYCVWSMQEDLQGVTVSVMPGVQSATPAGTALSSLLSSQSRWARGTVTHMNTGGASMYDRSAWEALSTLVEVWGGEVDATISVDALQGVTGRAVDLYSAQGEQDAYRRFDFGADLQSVKRTLADDPLYCRISPRGKGEETDAGGYGRKITIASVNGGVDWLEYAPMVDAAKLPDGQGGYQYPTLIVENSDCETPTDLKAWAQEVLEQYCTPKVTYEIDVLQAGIEGVDVTGVSLGDAVQVVDRKFGGDGVRVQGRVRSIVTDLLNERDVKITIGDAVESVAAKFASVGKSLAVMGNDLTTMSTAEYIDSLLQRINTEINATGGYTYITEGQGIRTYDTAVTDPLVGSEASKVVEIKGGSVRIADSKTAQGEWEWKTVFTSGHIAADLITAANITAGYIGDAANTSYWDIDNGQMVIRGGVIQTTIGSTGTVTSDVMWKRFAVDSGYSTADTYGLEVKRPYTGSGWIGIFPASTDDFGSGGYHWGSIIGSGRLLLAAYGNDTTSNYGFMKLNTGSVSIGCGTPATSFGNGILVNSSSIRLHEASGGTVSVGFAGQTSDMYSFSSSALKIGINSNVTANLQVYGNSTVSGTKSRLVGTEDYNDRLLYAYETPSPMFGDLGSGTIGEDGLCYVEIDDIFSETARADLAYQVFLQKCGEGDLWVDSKAPTHFIVRGTPGLRFDWELKAKQLGFETLRLEDADLGYEYEYDGVDESAYADELDWIGQVERALYEAA